MVQKLFIKQFLSNKIKKVYTMLCKKYVLQKNFQKAFFGKISKKVQIFFQKNVKRNCKKVAKFCFQKTFLSKTSYKSFKDFFQPKYISKKFNKFSKVFKRIFFSKQFSTGFQMFCKRNNFSEEFQNFCSRITFFQKNSKVQRILNIFSKKIYFEKNSKKVQNFYKKFSKTVSKILQNRFKKFFFLLKRLFQKHLTKVSKISTEIYF